MLNDEAIYWTAGFLNERFSAPVSPLGWSVIGPLFEQIALRDPLRYLGYPDANTIPATRLYRGHPYTNVRVFQIIYRLFPDALLPADAVRYFPNGAVSWRKRAPYPRRWWNPRVWLSLLAHVARDPLNVSPLNFGQWSRFTRRHNARTAELNARLVHADDAKEILDIIAATRQLDAELLRIHRWSLTYADVCYKLLERLAPDSAQALIADVPNLSTRVDEDARALAALAARVGVDFAQWQREGSQPDSRSPVFDAALEKFLRVHGHRSFSLDIAQPTIREEPRGFLQLISSRSPDPPPPRIATAARSLKPLLYFARRYAALREDQRYYWHKSLAVTRRAYLWLGALFCEQGTLDTPQQIFYATRDEIETYCRAQLDAHALQALTRPRAAIWADYETAYRAAPARAYPAFLRGDEPLQEYANGGEEWRGRGVSPGIARGAARVIVDGRELARVQRGEILVAPATDPGWTPVFARLNGLILERGGVLSHGAVVAREYHLPAVAAIPNITRELRDGDWVEVDGTRGVVRRVQAKN